MRVFRINVVFKRINKTAEIEREEEEEEEEEKHILLFSLSADKSRSSRSKRQHSLKIKFGGLFWSPLWTAENHNKEKKNFFFNFSRIFPVFFRQHILHDLK